jgi:hypothetical protein
LPAIYGVAKVGFHEDRAFLPQDEQLPQLPIRDVEAPPPGQKIAAPANARAKPLSSDEILRGYELEEGRMVTITDEEFESAAPETSRDIELSRFVPLVQISPSFISSGRTSWRARKKGGPYRPASSHFVVLDSEQARQAWARLAFSSYLKGAMTFATTAFHRVLEFSSR